MAVDVPSLAAYARVCRLPLSGSLPLTYPHLLAFPLQMVLMAGDGFPLPLVGAVHVENRIEVDRPIAVEEPLDVDVWARDLRPHRRGTQVDLVSEVSTRGEVVWRGVSTYLARGAEQARQVGAAQFHLDIGAQAAAFLRRQRGGGRQPPLPDAEGHRMEGNGAVHDVGAALGRGAGASLRSSDRALRRP